MNRAAGTVKPAGGLVLWATLLAGGLTTHNVWWIVVALVWAIICLVLDS